MWILAMAAGTARAGGVLIGATAGPALPLQVDTDSETGLAVGGVLGYRASVGPVHLRPDVIVRHNTSARHTSAEVGGAVTLGAPIAIGPYAHFGIGFEGVEPVGNAGLVAEVGLLKPLYLAVSAGWERSAGALDAIAGRYASNWLVAQATIGVTL